MSDWNAAVYPDPRAEMREEGFSRRRGQYYAPNNEKKNPSQTEVDDEEKKPLSPQKRWQFDGWVQLLSCK